MSSSVTLTSLLLLLVPLLLASASINPPIPILAPSPGLILANASRAATVVVEAFLETNCGDSARAWSELKQLSRHYTGDKVAVVIHQVPLPYHRNSMICTQGLRVIQKLMPSKVINYIDAMYDNLPFLSNSLTYNLDEGKVLDLLADIAVTATGIKKDDFIDDINSHRGYAVYAWKFGTSRGVAGTPWYMVNSVNIGANPGQLITKDDWVEYLDSLLG